MPEKNKVVLLGAYGVGKTCILRRFAEGSFEFKHTPTIGVDFQNKTVQVGSGDHIKLQIWDSAGQERFSAIAPAYFKGSQGIVVVYDMTDRSTYERANWWLSNLRGKFAADIPDIDLVLVANKSDLTEQHEVRVDEGQQLAEEFATHFHVVSAKENTNVAELFSSLASRIVDRLARAPVSPAPAALSPAAGLKQAPPLAQRARSKSSGCCGSKPER